MNIVLFLLKTKFDWYQLNIGCVTHLLLMDKEVVSIIYIFVYDVET